MTENKGCITVALIGNPNSGKSTIFNSLTGSNQHVGNYPGVTVEKKEGYKKYNDCNINFIDLPGTYSLSAYSDDEAIARDFLLLKEKPDITLNVINVVSLERNLYLFTQITELDTPIIIALNMIDILESQGKIVDKKTMSDKLGVPVFPTVASKGIGISDILDSIVFLFEEKRKKNQLRAQIDYGDVIKDEKDKLKKLILKNSKLSKFPINWISIELLDKNPFALGLISKTDNESEILRQIKKSTDHIKEHFGAKAETEIANRRYGFAKSIEKNVIEKTGKGKIDITEIIDDFAINRYLGIPIFALVMYIIFKFTFTFSGPAVNLVGLFFDWVGVVAKSLIPYGPVQSLIVDGIISGVGGVLGFFPLILFMFFAIAFFEESGYMARASFVMDKTMHRFGVHGKSFLPLMLSTTGCAVPGILATRTLDSKRDRLITMFIVSFMICGAKLPVFALIIGAFFAIKYQVIIMFFMYVLSLIIALSVAKLLSVTILKGEPSYLVMELPPYHLPTIKGLFLKMWERGWLYVRKVGPIVVFISVLIWVMFSYPKYPVNEKLDKVQQSVLQIKHSLAGRVGKIVEPLFKPIGMDGNRAIALIVGVMAKEMIVSSLATIYAIEDGAEKTCSLKEKIAVDKDWSPLIGIVFLVFCMIYLPCVVAVSVFFKETGSSYKWLALLVIGNTVFAWIFSFIVFQLGTLLEIGLH
ncbi:MAG: ferrous iron transport protein B [Endomicrobium sp.]|jgi:ferrous iron transport protein B|nr:ferrous iron transport protein B [Endomicrobium sp.]